MQLVQLKRLLPKLGTQGTAMMEAGIIFPFLMLSYVGIVGLTQYMDTHRHIFQTANQVATAMSMERKTGDATVLDEMLKFANITTSPDDISVSYIICGESASTPGLILPTSPSMEGITGKGTCGRGASAGSENVKSVCPKVMPGPDYGQFVTVTTSCRYTPSFNFFGLLNLPMSTTVYIPLREFSYMIP